MKSKLYFSALFMLLLNACSQEESQPYVEQNNTLSNSHD